MWGLRIYSNEVPLSAPNHPGLGQEQPLAVRQGLAPRRLCLWAALAPGGALGLWCREGRSVRPATCMLPGEKGEEWLLRGPVKRALGNVQGAALTPQSLRGL